MLSENGGQVVRQFLLLEVKRFNREIVFSDNLDATEIPDHSNVQRVASLLGVPKQPLIDALTRKTIFASGETVVSIQFVVILH